MVSTFFPPRWVLTMVVALATVSVGSGHASAAAQGPPDVIRMPELAAPGDPVKAIVATRTSSVGRRFSVTAGDGRVVRRGRLGKAAGSSAPWAFVALADLSGLAAPGTYHVHLGHLRSSRPLVLDPAARAHLLARLLRLYAVNLDGDEPGAVFGPSHLHDATVSGGAFEGRHVDLVGGWRDAGDFLKFTLTIADAVELLHRAAVLDPAAAHMLRTTAQAGIRWLLKAHPAPDLFVAQVGDESDHLTPQIFRDPAGDDSLSAFPTIANRHGFAQSGSGVAGAASAALAASARDEPERGRRDQLVKAAREWYAYGQATAARGPALGAITDPTSGKPSAGFAQPEDWTGYMALAAAELHRTTGDQALATDAVSYLQAPTTCFVCGVDSSAVGPLAAADLCGALGLPGSENRPAREAGCQKLQIALGAATERYRTVSAFGTPQEFTFGWSQGNGGQGALVAAAARARVAGASRAIAAGARDFLLGRNPWGVSFVIGPGPGRAHDPHHAAYLRGSPSRLLNGAVVGGPAQARDFADFNITPLSGPLSKFNTPKATYEDRRSDFITSEVGLAYTSFSILLVAAL